MKVLVFDTETTSLDKPFCYNIGYSILDTDDGEIVLERDYVVEQIWHNLPLFQSAYYADKRPLYVSAMKARRAIMDKFGYICRQISRDIKAYGIESAYAYNSNFDERVFEFNCDWFKCNNPFESTPIYDIRGYAHSFLCGDDYIKFCEENKLFTESGNYSTTAESLYRYLIGDPSYEEEHTALADSEIEAEILFRALCEGAELATDYPVRFSFERKIEKTLNIVRNKETIASFTYQKMTINKERTKITLK